MPQRHVRACQAAHHIGNRHHYRKMPPDVAAQGKQDESGQVGGGVEQLGRCGRIQKVIAQQAHQRKHEKAAGAGTKKTVVKPQHQANGHSHQRLCATGKAGRVGSAQLLFCQGVDQHGQQDKGQRLAQKPRRDDGHRPGPGKRSHKARQRGRQQGCPAQVNAPAELPCGQAGAPDGRAFVGAQQCGRVRAGESRKQGRYQDQAAAAHNGIHKACAQGGQRHDDQIHAGIVASGTCRF